MINSDKIRSLFSADGTQLLGVDVDGARLKMNLFRPLSFLHAAHWSQGYALVLFFLFSDHDCVVANPYDFRKDLALVSD
jgi:hypothetical protein